MRGKIPWKHEGKNSLKSQGEKLKGKHEGKDRVKIPWNPYGKIYKENMREKIG